METEAMTKVESFDYGSLSVDLQITLKTAASDIKTRMRRAGEDVFEIGRILCEIKAKLKHGQFMRWVSAEFGMGHSQVLRLIQVHQKFGDQNRHFGEFQPSVLYLLAAPATPDEAIAEAVERVESGETPTVNETKEIIARHKAQLAEAQSQLKEKQSRLDALAAEYRAAEMEHNGLLERAKAAAFEKGKQAAVEKVDSDLKTSQRKLLELEEKLKRLKIEEEDLRLANERKKDDQRDSAKRISVLTDVSNYASRAYFLYREHGIVIRHEEKEVVKEKIESIKDFLKHVENTLAEAVEIIEANGDTYWRANGEREQATLFYSTH